MESPDISVVNDRSEWTNSLLNLPATLYHTWEWGEVRSSEGWKPWRILLKSAGSVRAAVQVLERQLPAPGCRILYAPRGIAFSSGESDKVLELANWLKDFVRQRRAILLRMDPFFLDSDTEKKELHCRAGFRSLPYQWTRWNLPRPNMVIDISRSKEEILGKMRPRFRSYIRRAEKRNLPVLSGDAIKLREDFYSLLQKTSERQNFSIRDFQYISQLIETFSKSGNGSLFVAYEGERPAAGIFCARFSGSCYYTHGGFDWERRELHAIEPLHWAAINWAKKFGCTTYDLLGAGTAYPPKESNYGYGLYNFKRGLGADLLYLAGYFDLVGNTFAYRMFRFGEDSAAGSLFGFATRVRNWFRRNNVPQSNPNCVSHGDPQEAGSGE